MIDRSLNYGRDSIRRFLADLVPYRVIIDLGAGHGDDLGIAHTVCPAARLIAIENHPPYATALQAAGAECHSLDIERDRLPLPDESADAVIANQVLEHTKDIFWIFHEATRVLRPGGCFIIGVPNLASLHNRVLLAAGRQPTAIKTDSGHVRGFVLGDLLGFCKACFPGGYRVRAREGANFYPLPPWAARVAARALPGMAWGIMLCLQKTRPYSDGFIQRPIERGYETRFYTGTEPAGPR